MIRGYARTSRRTGVSFPLWALILFLPLAIFVGACYLVVGFFTTKHLSHGVKWAVFTLVAMGTTLAVAFKGRCDQSGICTHTKAQGDLTGLGAFLVVLALLLVLAKWHRVR